MEQKSRIKKQTFRAYAMVKKRGHYEKMLQYTECIEYDSAGRKKRHLARHEYSSPREREPFTGEYVYKYKEYKLIEDCYYQPAGNLLEKEIYIYDQMGRLTNIYTFDTKELTYEIQFIYGRKGYRIQMTEMCYFSGETTTRCYSYNTRGQVIKERIYENDDQLVEENNYVYNKQGKRIREISFDRWGSKRDVILYLYDKKNELVQKKYFQGTLKKMVEYTYAGVGKIKRILCRYFRFECDCMGVRRIPTQILETFDKYF